MQHYLALGAADALALSLQLSDKGDESDVLKAIVEQFSGLDILVNNQDDRLRNFSFEQDFGEIDAILVEPACVIRAARCALPS